MKILIIGSGGREHTLAWKIAQSPKVSKLYVAPGNAGTAEIAENVAIKDADIDALLHFALKEKIDLTVVGPEAPLVAGIVDTFADNGLKIFGPYQKGAMLEGSKVVSKELMKKYDIPTADFKVYDSFEHAYMDLEMYNINENGLVIKADGLAAGKGVFVCKSMSEAQDAVVATMKQKVFGQAGKRIVIEDKLEGTEASLLCFVSGNNVIPMVSARDYKNIGEGNKGANTGGMGSYSPNPVFTSEIQKEIQDKILNRIAYAFEQEGIFFKGILFIGLMITAQGPKVLEFNVRFGDPEAQVILPRLESDLVEIMEHTIDGTLTESHLKWSEKHSLAVILASGGYPQRYEKDKIISGLEELPADIMVFHAGTKQQEGKTLTNGGRVMAVAALGTTVEDARRMVYHHIDKIQFEKRYYRTDIGTA